MNATLEDRLPAPLRELVLAHDLKDGFLKRFEAGLRHVELELEVWEEELRNAWRYTLSYEDVRRASFRASRYDSLPGPGGFGELTRDEVDLLSDGGIRHRFLFSTGIELVIDFSTFSFAVKGRRAMSD
jgi:hypothetical protein